MKKGLSLVIVLVLFSITAVAQTPAPASSPVPSVSASSSPTPAPSSTGTTAPTTTSFAPAGAKGAVVLPPEKSNPVTIPKFDKPPVIDGKLDDAVWQNAAVLKDFYQIDPGDNIAPPTWVFGGSRATSACLITNLVRPARPAHAIHSQWRTTSVLFMATARSARQPRTTFLSTPAFDINILNVRGTYQFTKATFARVIVDYNTLSQRARSQFLAGWTPSPGTSFYVGYNDDINYNELHPFTRQIVPGFRRNSRTFFIKMSYLIRKSFAG